MHTEDHTPDLEQAPVPAAFQKPDPGARALDVDELLTSVRRVQTVARIYLRGDLVAERDRIIKELGSLVAADGTVIDDPEASAGELSNSARAQDAAERLKKVEAQMADSARWVRFEGLPSDEWAAFHRAHFPKGDKPDVTAFNTRLIAETAVEPTLTIAQVEQMRQALGSRQMAELANKAWESCNEGGVEVPKSPSFLLNLARQ